MSPILRIPDKLAKPLTAACASPQRLALDALQRAADELDHWPQPAGEIGDDAEERRAAACAAAARIRQAFLRGWGRTTARPSCRPCGVGSQRRFGAR